MESCNSLSACSPPPWTKQWSSGLLRRVLVSGWSRLALTWVMGGLTRMLKHIHMDSVTLCCQHRLYTVIHTVTQPAPLSISDLFSSSSSWHNLEPQLSTLHDSPVMLSVLLCQFPLSLIEVSRIEVMASDEEALSLVLHCVFRQANVFLLQPSLYYSPTPNPMFYSPFLVIFSRRPKAWWKTWLSLRSTFFCFFLPPFGILTLCFISPNSPVMISSLPHFNSLRHFPPLNVCVPLSDLSSAPRLVELPTAAVVPKWG